MIKNQQQSWELVLQRLNDGQKLNEGQLNRLSGDEQDLIQLIVKNNTTAESFGFLAKLDEDKLWNVFYDFIKPKRQKITPNRVKFKRLAVATTFIVIISMIIIVYNTKKQPHELANLAVTDDHKKAVLVTSDGKKILLNKGANKRFEDVDGVTVINEQSTVLRYQSNNNVANTTENKLIIPKGGEYKLVLSEGTEIHINSESVLKYPVQFAQKGNREVYLESGEAYFKVAEDPRRPFIVHTTGMNIRVLGTSFNVNTYSDIIQTTLVEGKVQVTVSGNKKVQLLPNQQAVFEKLTGELLKKDVDVTPFVGWKDGRMFFENSTIEEVMNNLGRWYDYDIVFAFDKTKKYCFAGSLKRYDDIQNVLKIIESEGSVKFSIKGKSIFVNELSNPK